MAYFRIFEAQPGGKYFLGLGLLPTLCGTGKGSVIMEQILAYAKKTELKQLYLEVRDFNQRAMRCYRKAGFV